MRHLSIIFALCAMQVLGRVSGQTDTGRAGEQNQNQHATPPPVINQCDHVLGNTNCGKWISDGAGGYSATWDHGEKGHIAIGKFDGNTVEFQRQDSSGKKSLSTYTGRIAGDTIVDGVITWKTFGHQFTATWTGNLVYPSPQPVPSLTADAKPPVSTPPAAIASPSTGIAIAPFEKKGNSEAVQTAPATSTAMQKSINDSIDQMPCSPYLPPGTTCEQLHAAMKSSAPVPKVPTAPSSTSRPDSKLYEAPRGSVRVLKFVQPVYPDAAPFYAEVTIRVNYTVEENGRAKDPEASGLEASSGLEVFRASAIEAVMQSVYEPFLLNGKPTPVRTYSFFVFKSPGSHRSPIFEGGSNPRLIPPPSIHECETLNGVKSCGTWTWNGSGYTANWDRGDTGRIKVTVFSGGSIEASRMDDSGATPMLQYSGWIHEGVVSKGNLANIPKPGERAFVTSWTAELLYPPALPNDSTGMLKFLLGTWVPAPSDPFPCPAGLSHQYCDMQRSAATQGMAQARSNDVRMARANGLSEEEGIAQADHHLVFTPTEVIYLGTERIPVTYSVSTPTSVVLTLYDDATHPTAELCKRMPDDQLTCTRFVGLRRKVKSETKALK